MNATLDSCSAQDDQRLPLLNTLLRATDETLQDLYPLHGQIQAADPAFYPRLAAWYFDRGDNPNHKVLFMVRLVLDESPTDRHTGLALLRRLPPDQVVRALDFIHGYQVKRKLVRPPSLNPRPSAPPRPKLIGRIARFLGAPPIRRESTQPQPLPTILTESHGLFRNTPRSLRTEITRYLRQREADADWFDASVLVARDALKRLYALNHIKPGPRAQRILFDENPPADSRLHALRQLARAATPLDQTRAIVAHAIPYAAAASVLKQMTPTVLLNFIEQMPPEEVLANVASLMQQGAMTNAYLKARIDRKVSLCPKGACAAPAPAVPAQRTTRQALTEITDYPLPQRSI